MCYNNLRKEGFFIRKLKFILFLFLFCIPSIPTYADLKTEKYRDEYNELYNTLSSNTKNIIDNYDIFFLKDKLINYDEFKTISEIDTTRGLIKYTTYQIYMTYNKEIFPNSDTIFYHEVGHAIDYSNIHNNIVEPYSNSFNFLELYEKYKKTDINIYADEKYFKSNPKEFFAECFAIYMKHPEKRYLIPEIYDFFDKITKNS